MGGKVYFPALVTVSSEMLGFTRKNMGPETASAVPLWTGLRQKSLGIGMRLFLCTCGAEFSGWKTAQIRH